jgi:hypothetical protein
MSESLSDLYMACRDGDLGKVQNLLPTSTWKEINRLETNGSTSLHAASYFNHPQIVELLLARGAMQSIMNKENRTPLDEASTEEVKQLFCRSFAESKAHFTSDTSTNVLEWVWSSEGDWQTQSTGNCNQRFISTNDVKTAARTILEAASFQTLYNVERIRGFLEEALETGDPIQLVKIYTLPSGFYPAINTALAESPSYLEYSYVQQREKFFAFAGYFAGCFIGHKKLDKYRYTDVSYRGMTLSPEYFEKNYKVGWIVLIKPFTSTSKCRDVAEQFLPTPGESESLAGLCIFNNTSELTYGRTDVSLTARRPPVALDISSISEMPHEEEVLIVPFTSFKIKAINRLSSGIIEINLTSIVWLDV